MKKRNASRRGTPRRGPQAAQHPAPAGAEHPSAWALCVLMPTRRRKTGRSRRRDAETREARGGDGNRHRPPSRGGPGWGPRKMEREKGRPGHPERAKGRPPTQGGPQRPAGGPGDPRAFAGAAGTPFFGRPANWRGTGPERRRPHPHQATPPATATTRPTPGRDKTRQFASGTARPGGAIPPGVRRPGRIPFKFRAQAPQWGRARNKRPARPGGPHGAGGHGGAAKLPRQRMGRTPCARRIRTVSGSSPTVPEAGE